MGGPRPVAVKNANPVLSASEPSCTPEIPATLALLPAVVNSFLFLSSVKQIVEHRQIKGKPVEHTDDFKLKATNDKTAPVTLVRLILAGGPLTEKQVGFAIFKLAIFSGILAIITTFLMGINS